MPNRDWDKVRRQKLVTRKGSLFVDAETWARSDLECGFEKLPPKTARSAVRQEAKLGRGRTLKKQPVSRTREPFDVVEGWFRSIFVKGLVGMFSRSVYESKGWKICLDDTVESFARKNNLMAHTLETQRLFKEKKDAAQSDFRQVKEALRTATIKVRHRMQGFDVKCDLTNIDLQCSLSGGE